MDKLVYHYCDNCKMANILSSKTLRMSDITKSNDYEEVKMFFPGILDAIVHRFANNYTNRLPVFPIVQAKKPQRSPNASVTFRPSSKTLPDNIAPASPKALFSHPCTV